MNDLGQTNANVLHLDQAATSFGDKFFYCADIKGDISKANVYASLVGGFGGDESLHDTLPELLSIVFISRVYNIAVSGSREFGKQDGVVFFIWSRFAIEHAVLHTAEFEESGDPCAPTQEVLFGQDRNCLSCCLKDGGIDGFHCNRELATGFVLLID